MIPAWQSVQWDTGHWKGQQDWNIDEDIPSTYKCPSSASFAGSDFAEMLKTKQFTICLFLLFVEASDWPKL